MSAIAQAQRNKNANLRRRSPTGHHDPRTNQQAVHQTYPRSLPSAPVIHHQTAKLSRSNPTNHRAQSRQAPFAPTAVALKSP
jgi:hypothetical protein